MVGTGGGVAMWWGTGSGMGGWGMGSGSGMGYWPVFGLYWPVLTGNGLYLDVFDCIDR